MEAMEYFRKKLKEAEEKERQKKLREEEDIAPVKRTVSETFTTSGGGGRSFGDSSKSKEEIIADFILTGDNLLESLKKSSNRNKGGGSFGDDEEDKKGFNGILGSIGNMLSIGDKSVRESTPKMVTEASKYVPAVKAGLGIYGAYKSITDGGIEFGKAPELFDDGYDFGDVTKSILGTVGDVGVEVGRGFGNWSEGVADAIGLGIADVAEFFGADETWVNNVRENAELEMVNDWIAPADEAVEKWSASGRTTDSIASGIGQMLPMLFISKSMSGLGAGKFATTATTSGSTFTSSFGNNTTEALREGASLEDAKKYGAIAATADTLTEMMFSGWGTGGKAVGINTSGTGLDDWTAKKVSNIFKSQLAKNWAEMGVKAGFEGLEEVAAGAAQALGKKMTYMSDEELGDILADENLLEQFVVGAFSSGVAQVGGVVQSNKAGRDFVTGYNADEQTVIDKEFEKRIKDAESDGKKVTGKDKSKIWDEVIEDIENGGVSVDSIEEYLGGDTYNTFKTEKDNFFASDDYKAYKDSFTEEQKLNEELEKIKGVKTADATLGDQDRLGELKTKLEDLKTKRGERKTKLDAEAKRINQIKAQLRSEAMGRVKDGKLGESYRELLRSTEKFTADPTKYKSEHAQKTVQNIMDSGLTDNSRKMHRFVEFLAKIADDRGVTFSVTDAKKMAGTVNDMKGATANAWVEGNEITINMDSKKRLNSLAGHEITHVLEGTQFYNELSKAVQKYAVEKGEWNKRLADTTALYKKYKPNADPVKEVVADLVGDYLFTDRNFVMNLSTKNRNLFQKVYDEIKYLLKMATAGSQEARDLERVKRDFEKAWRAAPKTNTDTTVKNSISAGQQEGSTTYIKDGHNQETGETVNFIDLILDGKKKGETRTHKSLTRKWVGIAKDGNVYGRVRLGEPYLIDKNSPEYKDSFIEGTEYDLKDNEQKYYYPILETEDFRDNPKPIEKNGNYGKFRYSISDSVGNQLSDAQAEFFKDSVVRDENGNLKPMYHGTSNGGYTVFNTYGSEYGLFGSGSYFTDSKTIAESYTKKGKGTNPQVYETYLNIKSPMDMDAQADPAQWAKEFPEVSFPESGTNEEFYRVMEEYLEDNEFPKWEASEVAIEALIGMGYDGITHIGGGRVNADGERHRVYIAFEPEQIKNTDNVNPTEDPDIRYSLTPQEEAAFVDDFKELHDVKYNLSAVETHKNDLQKKYTKDAPVDYETIINRYDGAISMWERISEALNSKYLNDWNSKVKKDRTFSVFKAQSGYKYNVELSSMCKKGVPLFEAIDHIVKNEIMKELNTTTLGKAEKEVLYDVLKKHGFDIPCAICYVEQARQREGNIINSFLNGRTDTDNKGNVTNVKLGWNNVLSSIEAEMKAQGVDYTFPNVSRDIATDNYSPMSLSMDARTQDAFYSATLKLLNEEIVRYNSVNKKSNRSQLRDASPASVKAGLKGTLPDNLKLFKVLLTEPNSRFRIDGDLLYSSMTTHNLSAGHSALYTLFNGQGGVSGYKTKQTPVIYWGDILSKKWASNDTRKEGGIRNQSNSDFQMYTFLDQAQMYIDFTAKGYHLQAYTKVLPELKLFGLSNGKINASLIPKVAVYFKPNGEVDVQRTMENAGLDANGNPIYDDIEGINHQEAFMLIDDPEYSKSITGICIGYSDNHISKLLDDNRVQLIIGYHDNTNDPSKRYRGAMYATNYTGRNEAMRKSDGETIHINFNPFIQQAEKMFKKDAKTGTFSGEIINNGMLYTADDIPKLAADLYLEHCAEKGLAPAYSTGGTDFSKHPNYYKLLADFGLYDSQGHYAPHRKVDFKLPDTVPYLDANGNKQYISSEQYIQQELAKEMETRDSLAEALADNGPDGIIPETIRRINEMHSGTKNSISADNSTDTNVGGYSVYGNDVKLRDPADFEFNPLGDIGPVAETVANTTHDAVDPIPLTREELSKYEVDSIPVTVPADELAPVKADVPEEIPHTQKIIDDLLQRKETLEGQMMECAYTGNFDNFPEIDAEYKALTERLRQLEAEEAALEEERMESITDTDAPPEIAPAYENVSDNIPLTKKLVDDIAREVRASLALSNKQMADVRNIITEYSEQELPSRDQLFHELKDRFGTYTETQTEDVLVEAKNDLRKYRLYVDDHIKSEIADYRDLMRRNFGKVRFSKDGVSVDTAYEELANWYPNFFPKDIINPTDQLMQIIDVANMETSLVHEEHLPDEAIMDVADSIIHRLNEYKYTQREKQANKFGREAFDSLLKDNSAVPPVDLNRILTERTTTDEAPIADWYKNALGIMEDSPANPAPPPPAPPAEPPAEIGRILTEEPNTKRNRISGWKKFVSLFVDKGNVFETLSKKLKNRELEARYNSMHYSEGNAQTFIGKGDKDKGIMALNDIRKQIVDSGKEEAFSYYLYHLHNMDRMSLSQRGFGDDKAVFGNNITADMSRVSAANLESKNPEFRHLANEIYKINLHLRQMLVDNGIISQETADLWQKMYPHYVPIRREGHDGLAVNVPLDTNKTGVNAPVKRATGGNSNILPMFDTMAQRILQTYKAVAKNRFGVELKNTMGTEFNRNAETVEGIIDSMDKHDELLKKGEFGMSPTFTVFENGQRVEFEITEEMYDALAPTNDFLSRTIKPLNAISNIRRGLITEYNPVFLVTNAIKDSQDVLINSQHPARTYWNMPQAAWQMLSNGKWYKEYMANGGEQNTYFEKDSNTFKEKSTARKVVGFPLDAIAAANNFVERLPRLAEYMASRKAKRSIDVSMLDAARVTTNFAAGGDVTKWANRNGATFFNASVQGAAQNVRNVREAYHNGIKGWAQLAAKTAIAGLPAVLLNHLLWEDDEEYEELSDYVKENYYIVAKFGDGQFVRIPKGRTVAVIQEAFQQMYDASNGEPLDLGALGALVVNNLAPNNPLDNNIASPIIQAGMNKAWHGGDIVPQSMEDIPAEEQYDESTSSIARWIGEATGTSPMKWNYVLDQYSGGLGDTFLPMMTPEAERGDDSYLGKMVAPWVDKFTTDSVLNNQNVSDFYDLKDELAINANSSKATDDDVLMSKYMNSVSAELNALYTEKREIQNSNMSDSRKYEAVRDVQKQINERMKDAMSIYEDVEYEVDAKTGGRYAVIGGKYFKETKGKYGTTWSILDEDETKKYQITSADGDANYATDGETHYRWYVPDEDSNEEPGWKKVTETQLKKQKTVTRYLGITADEYWSNRDDETQKVYDWVYDNPEDVEIAKDLYGDVKSYYEYKTAMDGLDAKDANGNSVSGLKKERTINYINDLDLEYGQKIIMFKKRYPADDSYNYDIIDYLNSRDDISYNEMKNILLDLGFKVDSNGNITWD